MRAAASNRPVFAALAAIAVAAVALVATGCGIRPTSVPVDAGSAPSRAECAPGGPSPAASAADGETLRTVYLVCGARLAPVPRSVPGDLTGTALAARLLAELERDPADEEERAGYSTAVSGLRVRDGHPGDPAGTVRLSRDPHGLGSPTLAQLVCTYATGQERTAVLAGPGADDPPYTYRCTDDALRAPENTVGEPAT